MPTGHGQSRLLLVGADPTWHTLVVATAARLGAEIDTVADVPAALGRMLRPDHVYDHVLAVGPISSREMDALAGMLDEVTLRTTPLLLLGCVVCGGANAINFLDEPDGEALYALLAKPARLSCNLAPLTGEELVSALHGGGLRMRFQPILRMSDFKPIGVEALARVHTRERGILHPKDFIPATLSSGRERVLTSIAAARTFLDIGARLYDNDLFVTINLPLASVMHESALHRAIELCAVAGVAPSRVMIEVLESKTAPDLGLLRTALEAWRREGFLTAIDDAGPALPHWREMMALPFDVVKLDGALIADPAADNLMRRIVDEAKARDRFIIAEGIENEACLERVRPFGVDALQGFLFARPLPALALPLWLRQWASHDTTRAEAELVA